MKGINMLKNIIFAAMDLLVTFICIRGGFETLVCQAAGIYIAVRLLSKDLTGLKVKETEPEIVEVQKGGIPGLIQKAREFKEFRAEQ